MTTISLPLLGPTGEPADLRRTMFSNGFADLPPLALDRECCALEATVPVRGARPRTVRVTSGGDGEALVRVSGRTPGPGVRAAVAAVVRHVLRLDEDLSGFYAIARADPEMAWACRGAGRMIRSPTVFEDVIKTLCTTNCSWALTRYMVTALVSRLGAPAADAPRTGWRGRAFPSPEAMAQSSTRFYRDVVHAGYRAPYLRDLSRAVADGKVDLETLGRAGPGSPTDDEVAERLAALPGIGPYAVAHIMMLIGRYSRPTLDSWTRPAYARLRGRRSVADRTIERAFRGYGPYAGLAFWLLLTREWVDAPPAAPRA